MAKADCTPLAAVITDIVRDLFADENIKTLDDAVFELQKSFPIITRDEVVRSMNETLATERRVATEQQRNWRAAVAEAKADQVMKEANERVADYLEKGELPEPTPAKPTREASETMQQLRRTRDNLNKWLRTSDPAMKIKLQEKLDALNGRIERGDLVMDEQRRGEFHDTLRAIMDEIEKSQRQIADAKTFKRLDDKINELQRHLDEGTLPPKKPRPARGEGVLDSMRNVRDELRKKLSQSEPAVKERLQKQIDDLSETMRQIEAGTYEPPVKREKTKLSRELEIKEFERDQLRKAVRQGIENLRPKSLWSKYNPFAFFHDMLTNGELSVILRQGGIAQAARIGATVESLVTGKPTLSPLAKSSEEIGKMWDAMIHPKQRVAIMAELMGRDSTRRFIRAGGHISPIEGGTVAQREEFSMSKLTLKIPVMRDIAQAGSVFLNLMRVNMFETMSETLALGGSPTAAEMKIIANMANQATGRGYEGGGAIGQGARVFFSFQYLTSRFNMLTFQPVRGNWDLTAKRARLTVAHEYGRIFLGLSVMYLAAIAAGAEIEDDSTSSDFLKWKFGRSRVDPLMGFNQLIVFGSRLATGERTSAATGRVTTIRGQVEYGQKTARDVIWDFLNSKAAPLPSFAMNVISGQKMTGEPTNLAKELKGMMLPVTWVDVYHAMEEDGIPKDAAVSILAFFGMGLQTFQPEEWPRKTTSRRRR